MSKPKLQFRQGDVLIEKLDTVPSSLKKLPKENGRVILAHGEVTGHTHEILHPETATMYEVEESLRLLGDIDGVITQAALVITGDSAVVHQEHGAIPLARASYIIRRQREYHPGALRNVAD